MERLRKPDAGGSQPGRVALEQDLGQAECDRAAVRPKGEDKVGERPDEVRVMLDEDDGRGAGCPHRREPRRQLAAAVGIEVRRRLVQDQDRRVRREDPRDGEPLLLTAGQAAGASAVEPSEAEPRERRRDARPHRRRRPPEALEAERNLVIHALHDELALWVLEDDPDRAGDERLAIVAGPIPGHDELAVEAPPDRSGHEPGDRAGQRALARSGWADDQEAAALRKVE